MDQPIDAQVRANLMRLRVLRGLSEEELGHAAGIAVAQVMAFESGAAVIDCAALFLLAQALQVPVATMYDGLALPSAPAGTELEIDHITLLEIHTMLKALNALSETQRQMVKDYIQAVVEFGPRSLK